MLFANTYMNNIVYMIIYMKGTFMYERISPYSEIAFVFWLKTLEHYGKKIRCTLSTLTSNSTRQTFILECKWGKPKIPVPPQWREIVLSPIRDVLIDQGEPVNSVLTTLVYNDRLLFSHQVVDSWTSTLIKHWSLQVNLSHFVHSLTTLQHTRCVLPS